MGRQGKASEIREEKHKTMAHKNDYQIQKQLDKPQTWFCKYYPARIRNVGEKEIADRQLVFDFKDGRAYEEVAQRTAENMLTLYGKGCVNIVFAPVPASTSEATNSTTRLSATGVCELTGAENGYEHVRVCGGVRPSTITARTRMKSARRMSLSLIGRSSTTKWCWSLTM